MALESLSAILPIIPQMLESGKSVWTILIKPLLEGLGYKYSQKQEKTILDLEQKKDFENICKVLQRIEKELNDTKINQAHNGDYGNQVGINNGMVIISQNISDNNFSLESLSDMAKKLLIDVSNSNPPNFHNIRMLGGYMGPYGNCSDPREIAETEEAIELLEKYNLIKPLGIKRDLYEITANGYKMAEKLSKA